MYDFADFDGDTEREHMEHVYATDSEIDQAGAMENGYNHPTVAWISSDRDVWYANPYYTGAPVPHPEDDDAWFAYREDPVAWRARELELRTKPAHYWESRATYGLDDMPF